MKKFFFLALILIGIAGRAQQYDVIDQVKSDWRKMAAMEGVHRFDWAADDNGDGYGNLESPDRAIPSLQKAPNGYKPFYISHYGRHGSRYAWDRNQYIYLRDLFTAAHKAGALTSVGEKFYSTYEGFYEMPFINTGFLTELGFRQHRRLGQYVYDAFPEVFRRNGTGRHLRVNAVSSVAQRCISSMGAFCQGLQGRAPSLDIIQSSTAAEMAQVVPIMAPEELKRSFKGPDSELELEEESDFSHSVIDYDDIISRIFSDPGFIKEYPGGRSKCLGQLFSFLGGYRNYSREPVFEGILTTDQMASLWESSNYSSYRSDYKNQYDQLPLLEDIIDKAGRVIDNRRSATADSASEKGAVSETVADLRFGHDFVIEAFMFLIGANGCNTIPASASEVKYWYQSYNIPMATTVLFVLYAKPGSDDILFKLVWNEEEATLPQLKPVQGCYYRWSDFKSWAEEIMAGREIH